MNDPIRSSLGRFSRRLDMAALASRWSFRICERSCHGGSGGRVARAPDRALSSNLDGPVAGFLFLIALVLAPAIVMSAATAAGGALAHVAKPSHELFCRFSMALLPLGLAMWGAHVSFHLSSAWRTAWPVMQRATGDLGAGWFGTPRWTASSPLFAADVLLAGQLLLLDAGILLSLYVGWRIARGYTAVLRWPSAAHSVGNRRSTAFCGRCLGRLSADADARDGSRVKTTLALMLNVMLAPIGAQADGGAVHLHEASGPFVVTVFTAPEVPRAGPIDTSVLVQDRNAGAVILDTTVNLELQPIGGTNPSTPIRATLGQAKNKLLQTVTIDVPAPGWWDVKIFVHRDRRRWS